MKWLGWTTRLISISWKLAKVFFVKTQLIRNKLSNFTNFLKTFYYRIQKFVKTGTGKNIGFPEQCAMGSKQFWSCIWILSLLDITIKKKKFYPSWIKVREILWNRWFIKNSNLTSKWFLFNCTSQELVCLLIRWRDLAARYISNHQLKPRHPVKVEG